MQKSEIRRASPLNLDLRPPVRLEGWAICVALSIAATTVAPTFSPAVVVAALIVCAASILKGDLLPDGWRMMAILSPLFVIGGVTVALLHASAPDPLAELAAIEPGEVEIVGVVASPPVETGFGSRADLSVETLSYGGRDVVRGGGVEIYAAGLDGVGVGDRLRVVGEISAPEVEEGGFDYGRYLATRRISAIVEASGAYPVDEKRGWIGIVHRRTDIALGYGLRPTEAAVVRGMVLGDRSLIPEELDEAFQRSGITHVLAISGQHVAVLAAVLYFMLRAFALPLIARSSLTLVLVWTYIFVAGAPPSAIRAGVVATLVLVAGMVGRQVSPLHFMSAMLAVVLVWNPLLVYNTGFQLSVAAVFGILTLRKPIKALIRVPLPGYLRSEKGASKFVLDLISISLAAQVATAPIIASTFDLVSVVGVVTNLIAVPISGPILTLGLVTALIGNIAPVLAFPLNAANGFLVLILENVALAASSLSFAAVPTPGVGLFGVVLMYLGVIPAALCVGFIPKERWAFWAGVMISWVSGWLVIIWLVGSP